MKAIADSLWNLWSYIGAAYVVAYVLGGRKFEEFLRDNPQHWAVVLLVLALLLTAAVRVVLPFVEAWLDAKTKAKAKSDSSGGAGAGTIPLAAKQA